MCNQSLLLLCSLCLVEPNSSGLAYKNTQASRGGGGLEMLSSTVQLFDVSVY